MRSAELLGAYARGLCSLSGAANVSLYVPARPDASSRALLNHDGSPPPVPELADLVQAIQFASEVSPRLRNLERSSVAPTAVEVASRGAGGRDARGH